MTSTVGAVDRNRWWQRSRFGWSSVALAAAIVIAGCSNGDPGEEATTSEPLCQRATSTDLTAAGYRALADIAPAGLRPDLEHLAALLGQIAGLPPADAEARWAELTSDPTNLEALRRLGGRMRDLCGHDLAFTELGVSSGQGPDSDSASQASPPTPKLQSPDGDFEEGDRNTQEENDSKAAGGIPYADVKAEMLEIFGDRLWGFSSGADAEGESGFEGNVSELTTPEALSACRQLSEWLAAHPNANATIVLSLTDYPRSREFNVLALNAMIRPGEPGHCDAP